MAYLNCVQLVVLLVVLCIIRTITGDCVIAQLLERASHLSSFSLLLSIFSKWQQ